MCLTGRLWRRSSLTKVNPSVHPIRPAIMRPTASGPLCLSRDSGAFVEKIEIPSNAEGPLNGLKFAVKDMFDIAGHPTGFGNPSWKATHPVPVQTSTCIQALLKSGATLIGKTHMDELAYSLNGQNDHYGTPLNPLAPDRVPGGSSSGSASAVACGEVDFSVGSDTAGSVRVPASFCGVLGIRTTHGVISLDHARPLAPRFDTVGWFASDSGVFKDVGTILLGHDTASQVPRTESKRKLLVCKDAMDLVFEDSKGTVLAAINAVLHDFASIDDINLSEGISGGNLSSWLTTFKTLQARQVWESHGSWIRDVQPSFGPGIKERFEAAALITDEQVASAEDDYLTISNHLKTVLSNNHILCVPSAPGPAPLINSTEKAIDDFRSRALCLTCIAGFGGFPQVSLPLGHVDGAPIGIGLIGPRHSDLILLSIADSIMKRQTEQPDRS